jgi:hypothetical protein
MDDKRSVEVIKLIREYCPKEITERVLHILLEDGVNAGIREKEYLSLKEEFESSQIEQIEKHKRR